MRFEEIADKVLYRVLWFCAAFFVLYVFAAKLVYADTGKLKAIRVAVGNALQTRTITLASGAVTRIVAPLDNRPDVTCVNNSAVTIWISSNVPSAATAYQNGFPVLASATFMLGSMSSDTYATPNTGSAAEVRCVDGMTL